MFKKNSYGTDGNISLTLFDWRVREKMLLNLNGKNVSQFKYYAARRMPICNKKLMFYCL